MEQSCILEMRNLSKMYDKISPPAVRCMNIRIGSGRIVGLLGPNGSGKTTILKLATGLLTPTYGEILIDGMNPSVETKKIVSYLPDRDSLPQWMRVEQALDYYEDFFEDFRRKSAERMLADLGVSLKAKIKTLSKGNREKVSLILTMSRDAKLYLLDEPLAGVDPATRQYILNTIISNYSQKSTVIISTHLIADVEEVLDDVIFLFIGNLELYWDAKDLREKEGKSIDELFREVYRW